MLGDVKLLSIKEHIEKISMDLQINFSSKNNLYYSSPLFRKNVIMLNDVEEC